MIALSWWAQVSLRLRYSRSGHLDSGSRCAHSAPLAVRTMTSDWSTDLGRHTVRLSINDPDEEGWKGFVRLTLRAAQCRDAHSTIPLPSASLSA